MHSSRLQPTKLILIGTRTTYQATGDAYYQLITCLLMIGPNHNKMIIDYV